MISSDEQSFFSLFLNFLSSLLSVRHCTNLWRWQGTDKCLQMSDGLANTAALIAEHQMRFFRNSTFQLFVKFSTVICDFFPFCLQRCIYLIVVSKQHLNFIIICEAEDNNMYSTHFSLFCLSEASSPSYVSYFILLVFTD